MPAMMHDAGGGIGFELMVIVFWRFLASFNTQHKVESIVRPPPACCGLYGSALLPHNP